MEKYNKEIVESSTNNKFLFELDQELLKGEMYKAQNDKFTTDVLRSVTDKHTPLKTKNNKRELSSFHDESIK